jgi:phage terminase small subunit
MLAYNRPKKVKGARKKAREALIARLYNKFPTWFENKSEKEIVKLVSTFKATGMDEEQFSAFCTFYEAKLEQNLIEGA